MPLDKKAIEAPPLKRHDDEERLLIAVQIGGYAEYNSFSGCCFLAIGLSIPMP